MAIEVVSVHEPFREKVKRFFKNMVNRVAGILSRRKIKFAIKVFAVLAVITATFAAYLLASSYNSYAQIIDERLARGYLTSRPGLYAAPRKLQAGQKISIENLAALLKRTGYIEGENASVAWNGSFLSKENSIEIHPRINHEESSFSNVSVVFNNQNRIASIIGDGATIESFALEPEILSNDFSMKTNARSALSFQDIPPVLVKAILAIEDRRFFSHSGVDGYGVVRAIFRNTIDDDIAQGGSTITQQLIKNTYLTPEKTFQRKYSEAMLALALEKRFTKEEIFALYSNEIYLGQRGATAARGVEQAARLFFGKELKDISLAEAATIAGMIQSPNRYSPERHAQESLERRRIVLGAMVRDGAITLDEAKAASNEELKLITAPTNETTAPYFVDYANRVVETELAKNLDERSLRIQTTIDLELQTIAERAVKNQMFRSQMFRSSAFRRFDAEEKPPKGGTTELTTKPQVAFVAIETKTGNVVAMVGGRDYAESQLNRATDAQRQPGSVFKPFVYAAAIESGMSPVTMFKDAPQTFTYDKNKTYKPKNYGGGFSGRDVMMYDALVRSLNVVTVDVALQTGLKRVTRTAWMFGLKRPPDYPSTALGTSEATPLEIAAAYTAFANGGVRVLPNVVSRAIDANGFNYITGEPRTQKVIEPATAYVMTDMMQAVITRGTARAAHSSFNKISVAGKTGTSHDGWFVGYTPNLVCAVWVGFDDNKELNMTGAESALPICSEFMKQAVDLRPELGGEFSIPQGIDFIQIDPSSGQLATPTCPVRETIAVTRFLSPHTECLLHVEKIEEAIKREKPSNNEKRNDNKRTSKDNEQILARVFARKK
jgi:penicillin-binding protein 1B